MSEYSKEIKIDDMLLLMDSINKGESSEQEAINAVTKHPGMISLLNDPTEKMIAAAKMAKVLNR